MKPIRHEPGARDTQPGFPSRHRPQRPQLRSARLRDWWWWLQDCFEHSRRFRLALYLSAAFLVLSLAVWLWVYPWWIRHSAVTLARKWLDSGHLRYAAEAAQEAARLDPDNPEPWRIAAELARRGGQYEPAREYSRRAAAIAPDAPFVRIDLAADLLLSGQTDEADHTLDGVSADVVMESPDALRLRGEISRRRGRLAAARGFFERAIQLEGPKSVNEVPLAVVLLPSANAAERNRGLALLTRRAADANWGPIVLRILLDDASLRRDHAAMLRWAEALRSHPGCTVSDMPRCLQAFAAAAPARYEEMLAGLKKDHAVTPQATLQLISWLNQIGRGADAVQWMQALPHEGMKRPPLAVAGAEALRQAGAWQELRAWTAQGDWGADAEFLRWCYGLAAARQLGDETRAQELSQTLQGHAELDGTHGLFAAASLYSWGLAKEGEALWWKVSAQSGPNGIEALGALARHYQTSHDADGQYRVFRQLHSLRPADRAIANNFAFFAALTGRAQRQAEQIARENLQAEPANLDYLATAAFVLLQAGRTDESLAMLAPKADAVTHAPGLAFAYGLALARAGRLTEAQAVLLGLPSESLTLSELELIRALLPGYRAQASP